jgi:hypothetical protein
MSLNETALWRICKSCSSSCLDQMVEVLGIPVVRTISAPLLILGTVEKWTAYNAIRGSCRLKITSLQLGLSSDQVASVVVHHRLRDP